MRIQGNDIMNKKVLSILIGVLLLFTSSAVVIAQDEPSTVSLTVKESTQRAVDYNLDASRELYTLKKLAFARNTSWGAVIPDISVSARVSRSNVKPSVPVPGDATQNQWGLNAGVSLSTPLGPLLAQKIIAVIEPYYRYDIRGLTYSKAIYQISLSVQKSYFDILLARSQLELYKRQLGVAEQQNQDAEASYKSGTMSESNYLQTRIALLQREAQARNQKATLVDLYQKFAMMLGYDINTPFVLTDSIPEIPDSEVQELMAKNTIDDNYDIKIQTINTKALALNRINMWFGIMPTVSLHWNMLSTFTKDVTKDSITDFGNNWSDDTGQLGLTIALSISNLIPGSRAMNAIVNAGYDIKIQQLNAQNITESTKQRLVSLQTTLTDTLVNLDVSSEQRDLAQKSYDLVRVRYGNGLSSFTDYINAEKEFINSEQGYLSQKVRVIKTVLDIQYLAGDEK